MSKLETNTIDNISGSSTLKIGDTNATTLDFDTGITEATNIPYGLNNTPAFEAYLSSETNVASNNVYTKIQFDTEIVDTDNAYDNSSNYRFTVPTGKAGKYFFALAARCISSSNTTLRTAYVSLYKNGSQYRESQTNFNENYIRAATVNVNAIMDLSVGDYVEGYVAVYNSSGSRQVGDSQSGYKSTYLMGYRLIGV